MSVFMNTNPIDFVEKIYSANSKVIYISPGLDENIAGALINTAKKIGIENVIVLLDISENVLRYGYGSIEGITLLKDNGISIKQTPGIRIGALIYDEQGLIFSPTPLLIEDNSNILSHPNTIAASPEQIKEIINAIQPSDREPEIGLSEASTDNIYEVHEAINNNPPQQFDIARKVQVFSSEIEFVEIKLKGCEIQRHTVSIPTELLIGETDSATKKQLKAGFNIIEKGSSLSGESIRNELQTLKRSFLKSIPKYGNVILKSKKQLFKRAIDELKHKIDLFQNDVENNLSEEIQKAKNNLVEMLLPAVTENPPNDLLRQISVSKPSSLMIEKYLSMKLNNIFPSATNIINAMSIECITKAVTYETLLDNEFQKNIQNSFPLIPWDDMFDEYDAAREKNNMSSYLK